MIHQHAINFLIALIRKHNSKIPFFTNCLSSFFKILARPTFLNIENCDPDWLLITILIEIVYIAKTRKFIICMA